MISNIYTIALNGFYGTLVNVQICIVPGIPRFEIVRITRHIY